jgi:hypothetical protein
LLTLPVVAGGKSGQMILDVLVRGLHEGEAAAERITPCDSKHFRWSVHLARHVMRIGIRHLSKSVQRTPYAGWPRVENMCVNHGRLDILVPQQLLDRSDVVTAFKQMGGEGMPEGVAMV